MRCCDCCRGLAVCAAALCILAGCGEPVREDRSITWTPDGQASGFQHGDEGVFVSDGDSGQLTKVFSPEADVLATSTPLWSPDGQRFLFMTARPPEQPDQQNANTRAELNEETTGDDAASASGQNQQEPAVDTWGDNGRSLQELAARISGHVHIDCKRILVRTTKRRNTVSSSGVEDR